MTVTAEQIKQLPAHEQPEAAARALAEHTEQAAFLEITPANLRKADEERALTFHRKQIFLLTRHATERTAATAAEHEERQRQEWAQLDELQRRATYYEGTSLMTMLSDLITERESAHDQQRRILETCETEKRDLTAVETQQFDSLSSKKRILDARIEEMRDEQNRDKTAAAMRHDQGGSALDTGRAPGDKGSSSERAAEPGSLIDIRTGAVAAIDRKQSFRAHSVVAAHEQRMHAVDTATMGHHGSMGQFFRAMTTSSVAAPVPTVWAGDIIDRARNHAAVIQAGAEIVPMDAKIVQIARLTGDPTAAFRTEGSAVTASDLTMDNVTLTAKTMSALVVVSMEWLQDAIDADNLIADAIAKQVALTLDLTALYGSITTGAGAINLPTPPNPRGVLGALLANASANVLGAATNGTTQTAGSYWNELLDLIFTVRDNNEEPTGILWNTKLKRQYAKAYDSQGQPLRTPEAASAVPFFDTNQIPSYTQGTMTNTATDAFCGDWRQLIIGQRLDMTMQMLDQRYAENGQVGIVCHWRGDIQPARDRAFAVYRALKGA